MSRHAQYLAGSLLAAACVAIANPCVVTAQETRLHGFADVQARASDAPGAHTGFALGQFVAHVTTRLSDHWSFLGELAIEAEGTGFTTDVERIIVNFTASDQFQVSFGKQHTPIGAWNNAYHHGTLFQPTITRPLLVQFEDDGGILPVHSLGVRLSGQNLTSAHVGYDLMVGNGIGATADGDNNNGKLVTAQVYVAPTSALRAGLFGYSDQLSAGTATLAGPALAAATRQTALGGFAVFEEGRYHAHSELIRIANRQAGVTSSTLGLFVYAGYRLGTWVPYGAFERTDYPASDPYFATDDYRQAILGLRRDLGPTVVIKFEYRNRKLASTGTISEAAAQVAVGF